MTNEEHTTPNGEGVPAEGSEAGKASGPEPQGAPDDVSVEDILGAEQTHEAAAADAEAAPADPLQDQANPYLDDLRRLTAEYANYRKRTADNAAIEKQRATARAIEPLLSVLDDLDRAEKHGDLEEGTAFATIAQKLRSTLERQGLTSYGEKGDAFDPQKYEAVAQIPVPGTEHDTVYDVIERGYRLGDVELRAAKVAVAVAANG